MKDRKEVALMAGAAIAFVAFLPLIFHGFSTHFRYQYLWWIALCGTTAAAVIIVAAFWEK